MESRRTFVKSVGAAGTIGLLAGCTGGGGGGGTEQPYGNGELNFYMSPSEPQNLMNQQYQPVKEHLSSELPVPASLRYASAYSAVIRSLGSGTGDVAETGPFAAALGVAADKLDIALQRKAFGTWEYSSVIVTNQDSNVESLSDLEGKTIYFADPLSASGSLYPLYALKQAGLSIGNMPNNDQGADFTAQYAGGHESAFRGLEQGQADAAGVGRFITLNDDREYREGIREVHRESGIPRAPVVISPQLSDSEQSAVVSAFQDAPDSMYFGADGEEGTDDDLWFSGVREASQETYQPVVEVAQTLNLETDLFDQLGGATTTATTTNSG